MVWGFESPSSHQTIRFKSRIWKDARFDIELGRRSLVRHPAVDRQKRGNASLTYPFALPKGQLKILLV